MKTLLRFTNTSLLVTMTLAFTTACKSKPAGEGAGSRTGSSSIGSSTAPIGGPGSATGSGSVGSAGSGSAGSSSAGSGSDPGSAAAVAPPMDGIVPAQRARDVIEKQVAALSANKNAELLAMFEPGAVVLVPDARAVEPSLDLVGRISGPGASVKIGKVAEGDSDGAIWLAADLEVTAGGKSRQVRAVELLDGAQGWKVAVASFAETQQPKRNASTPGPIPAPTDTGPLSALLAAPNQIATTLLEGDDDAPDVMVFGTEASERGVALVEAKLLAYKLGKLGFALEAKDKVHEVRTSKWGYAMGNVNRLAPPDIPYRMSGLVIAIPAKANTWSTVAVVYNAL